MTLSIVKVINAAGDELVLPLVNDSAGYVIQDITGLDPVKATVATSKYANFPGVKFQAASRAERNIVIKLGYEPDYSVESIQSMRAALYAWFLPESQITLQFTIGGTTSVPVVYEIAGVVESMENPLFSKDPAVDISIICPLPDFYNTSSVIFSGSSVSDLTEVPLVYDGSAAAGVIFTLNVNRDLSDIALNIRQPDGTLYTLSYSDTMVLGDTLVINTNVGNKSAVRTHLSIETNTLNNIPATSTFVQLKQGTNLIRVASVGLAIPYTLEYTSVYGGL